MKSLAIVLVALLLSALPSVGDDCDVRPDAPRTLVLALDGVPLRLVEQARAQGAFGDWESPRPLVSTFPSVTNVSFTAMFAPFGVEPAGGYEVQFFDWAENAVLGGHPWGYNDNLFAWRDIFDRTGRTVGGKLSIYTKPGGNTWKEVEQAEELILETEQELVLAHVGATDAMLHLRGDDAVLAVLLKLDTRIRALQKRFAEEREGALHVVMLSDHGNTHEKVRSADGVRKKLKKAGLHPSPNLEEATDVVAATFGILNYGVLFTRPENGETAARAMVNHKAVALAVWQSGPDEVSVVAKGGSLAARKRTARVRWRDRGGTRYYSYLQVNGDPLDLGAAIETMRAGGAVSTESGIEWAPEQAWLEASIDSKYPNAPRRVIDGLTGNFVANNATVIFSLKPGYGWGWQSAYASSYMWGGRLEGTHGGLDRDSSIGFFMADTPMPELPPVLTVTDVLEPFSRLERCRPPAERLTTTAPGTATSAEPSGN